MNAPIPDARPAAFGAIFVVAQHLDRLGDLALAPLGLTTKQWLLLAVVERAFGDRHPTLTEAAAVYGSSRQNVKAIARGLEAAGFLRIVPDPGDRRAARLALTDRVAVFASPEWRARETTFFSLAFGDLGPDETTHLADLLGRWLAALTPRPAIATELGAAATGPAPVSSPTPPERSLP